MFELIFSIIKKIKKDCNIIKKIFYLRKIKPKYLFFSEEKKYQKYSYLLIEALVSKYPKDVYYVSSDINDVINNSKNSIKYFDSLKNLRRIEKLYDKGNNLKDLNKKII